ncbi:hypothetical protein UJ101_01887 [Flavobacteriaceae bacterium UJ101]|nr:hypothetical protein UJ101_01887 [Flavobacteriaceae bacterium UJ101]
MMKKIIGIVLGVMFTVISCSGPKVMYDYDRSANFSEYKTYNFHPNMNLSTISELDGKRILNAIESQMNAKGFRLSDAPDLYVDVAPSSRTRKKQAGSLGIGLGNWGRNFGVNIGTSVPITTKVEDSSLVLEMIDANSNQMIWQGVFEDTASASSSPAEKEGMVNKSVSELLVNFPPK